MMKLVISAMPPKLYMLVLICHLKLVISEKSACTFCLKNHKRSTCTFSDEKIDEFNRR